MKTVRLILKIRSRDHPADNIRKNWTQLSSLSESEEIHLELLWINAERRP